MTPKKRKRCYAQQWNPNTIERFHDEGRGTGKFENYIPWINIQDFSSRGISARVPGWKSRGRPVHLFSNVELYHFYTVEWDDSVVDTREQFPLEMESTKLICKEKSVDHPSGPKEQPITMTTDMRLTMKDEADNEYDLCRSIKQIGTWLLQREEIVDLDLLVAQLRGQVRSHALSEWLMEQMSTEAQHRIRTYTGEDNGRLVQCVIVELNRILKGEIIYTPERFSHIYIKPETWQAVSEGPKEKSNLWVNRLLLKDAYPDAISQNDPFDGLTARDKEKFEVEKTYWKRATNAVCEMVTWSDLDLVLAKNVEYVHSYRFIDGFGISEDKATELRNLMWTEVEKGNAVPLELFTRIDSEKKLIPGTCLIVAKNAIASKEWKVDFTYPLDFSRPLFLL